MNAMRFTKFTSGARRRLAPTSGHDITGRLSEYILEQQPIAQGAVMLQGTATTRLYIHTMGFYPLHRETVIRIDSEWQKHGPLARNRRQETFFRHTFAFPLDSSLLSVVQ